MTARAAKFAVGPVDTAAGIAAPVKRAPAEVTGSGIAIDCVLALGALHGRQPQIWKYENGLQQ